MSDNGKPYLTYKLELIKTIAIKAADEEYAKVFDLQVRQLRVLRLLHDFPGISATELRHKLALDKTLMSKNLADLERRGLVVRAPDERDSRAQRLHLTEQGVGIWEQGEAIGRKLEAEMFAALEPAEWHEIHRLLDRLLASIEIWKQDCELPLRSPGRLAPNLAGPEGTPTKCNTTGDTK